MLLRFLFIGCLCFNWFSNGILVVLYHYRAAFYFFIFTTSLTDVVAIQTATIITAFFFTTAAATTITVVRLDEQNFILISGLLFRAFYFRAILIFIN